MLLPCQIEAADAWDKMGRSGYLISPVGHGKSLVVAECFRRSSAPFGLYLTTKSALIGQCDELRKLGLNVVAVDMAASDRMELWKDPTPKTVYVATLEAIGCPDRE
jgi:superfamily II DNA or RNA helicase